LSSTAWTATSCAAIAQAHDRRDNPTLIGYDENKFAANLFYDDQDA
jgi:hypothetical protein